MSREMEQAIADVAQAVAKTVNDTSAPPRSVVIEAIAGLPVAALVADEHGQFVASNDAAVALTGYPATELIRLSVFELTGSADRHSFAPLWRAFVGLGEQRGTYQLITKGGQSITVEYTAAVIAPGLHLSLLRPLDG